MEIKDAVSKACQDLEIKNSFDKDYKIIKKIEDGSYGTVHISRKMIDNSIVAVKQIKKTRYSITGKLKKYVVNEFIILKVLDHKNIIKCYDIYEDNIYYYIVMEYFDGHDLLTYLNINDGEIPQHIIKEIIVQTVDAIDYCHKNKIVHRDIKLENVLISCKNDKVKVKLIDFGFAEFISNIDHKYPDRCGSQIYASPELFITSNYDPVKCDIWSTGIMIYALVTKDLPYDEKISIEHICKYIIDYKDTLSQNHTKLLKNILTTPDKRFTLHEIKDYVIKSF